MTTERKTNDKGQTLTFGRWTPDAYLGEGGGFVVAYLDGAPAVDINARRNEDGTWKVRVQGNRDLEGWNGVLDTESSRAKALGTLKRWVAQELGFGGYRTAWSKGRRARMAKKRRVEEDAQARWKDYEGRRRAYWEAGGEGPGPAFPSFGTRED
mgnify:CR=1 FL=1